MSCIIVNVLQRLFRTASSTAPAILMAIFISCPKKNGLIFYGWLFGLSTIGITIGELAYEKLM